MEEEKELTSSQKDAIVFLVAGILAFALGFMCSDRPTALFLYIASMVACGTTGLLWSLPQEEEEEA